MVAPNLWPRVTLVWAIAYNPALVKNPPKSWADLTKPEYGNKQIGQVFAPAGGTTWTRVMFERKILGDDYWPKQAATKPALYPSGAPLSDALVRGEVAIAPLLYNVIYTKQRDGAPVKSSSRPEGAPAIPYATGIPKTAQEPQRRQALHELVPVEGGPVVHDLDAGQPDLPEDAAASTRRTMIPRS